MIFTQFRFIRDEMSFLAPLFHCLMETYRLTRFAVSLFDGNICPTSSAVSLSNGNICLTSSAVSLFDGNIWVTAETGPRGRSFPKVAKWRVGPGRFPGDPSTGEKLGIRQMKAADRETLLNRFRFSGGPQKLRSRFRRLTHM